MSPQPTPTNSRSRCRHASLARVTGWLATCLLLIACGQPAPDKVQLEAYSWWKRPSEQRAFENVLRIYNASQSRAVASNLADESTADLARATLTARLLAGAPPSTFQANAGADALRWSVVDTNDAQTPSRIADLSGLFQRNGLFDALPGPLLEALLAGNGAARVPYAVPINIHRLNVIYYNAEKLAAYGPGKSFLDLNVLCPADLETELDQGKKLNLKIAVGTSDTFALTLFALENVLPAMAGAQRYDQLFRGHPSDDWEGPVRHALDCVQFLSRSFLDDRDKGWAEALAQVQNGDADFSVMGDWANGELKTALEHGEVGAVPFPGAEQIFVFTSDTFPLPVDAPDAADSEAFLDTIASTQAQLEFSQEKGSIPARSDLSIEPLGPAAVATQAAFASDDVTKVLATSGLFPPYYPAELNDKLAQMTEPGATRDSVEDVMALLRDAQPLLARWQERLAQGPISAP